MACAQIKELFSSFHGAYVYHRNVIQDAMDRLSRHSSTGYVIERAINVAAMLLKGTLAVELCYHFRPYYWKIVSLLFSLLCVSFTVVVRGTVWIFSVIWCILCATCHTLMNFVLTLTERLTSFFHYIVSAVLSNASHTSNVAAGVSRLRCGVIIAFIVIVLTVLMFVWRRNKHEKLEKVNNETTERNSVKVHIHQDSPDAPICSDFILGKCMKGLKCPSHHCPLPFHWQYKRDGEWQSFSEQDNEKLEKLYCDVMLDECTVPDVQIAVESDGLLLDDVAYDVNIRLDKKLLSVMNGFGPIVPMIRRLSTKSYVADPSNTLATQWIWYWKDEHEIWRVYDHDHSGRDLQHFLEEAFIMVRNCFRFRIADQDYQVNFKPSSDMSQTNVLYGTTREVRRRPAKIISKHDISELKRSHSILSSKMPSHWSPMSSEVQYKRVPLASFSDEFKQAEKLFKTSIKRNVTVIGIERVQNPFMWEKYQRKKGNMSTSKNVSSKGASVNERRLFHGTSPEIVEAICKQNFDWRLHGKNATVYGEGSYFAVNSSYSDAYAKEDDLTSSKFMFVAKVLVGSYAAGDSSYRRPPQKDPTNPASDLYDSCVDDVSFPTIFVVFDTDQVYPEYIIEYSADSNSAHSDSAHSDSDLDLDLDLDLNQWGYYGGH